MYNFALFSTMTLASLSAASPLWYREDIADVAARNVAETARSVSADQSSAISFDQWGGIQSLAGFDNFFGVGNFDGFLNQQTVVVQEQSVVCVSQSINVIQQQLAILAEVAKQIISTQICEVETQTIVLQQLQGGLTSFSLDVQRVSQKVVGFDQNIAGLLGSLLNADGSLNISDFGFSGADIGKNVVAPGGSNWANQTDVVKEAQKQAQEASNAQKQAEAAQNQDQAAQDQAAQDQAAQDQAAQQKDAEEQAAQQKAAEEQAAADQAAAASAEASANAAPAARF